MGVRMAVRKLKFKRLKDGAYNPLICAVSKCESVSDVIDATKKLLPVDIPLCDYHNEKRVKYLFGDEE